MKIYKVSRTAKSEHDIRQSTVDKKGECFELRDIRRHWADGERLLRQGRVVHTPTVLYCLDREKLAAMFRRPTRRAA